MQERTQSQPEPQVHTPNGYHHICLRLVSRQEISKLTLVDITDEWK